MIHITGSHHIYSHVSPPGRHIYTQQTLTSTMAHAAPAKLPEQKSMANQRPSCVSSTVSRRGVFRCSSSNKPGAAVIAEFSSRTSPSPKALYHKAPGLKDIKQQGPWTLGLHSRSTWICRECLSLGLRRSRFEVAQQPQCAQQCPEEKSNSPEQAISSSRSFFNDFRKMLAKTIRSIRAHDTKKRNLGVLKIPANVQSPERSVS